jgi:putative lipoprotein (rSAM/lipoprotein system)
MKKIKLRALMGYNYLLSILLVVLGFSTACEQNADEYGTPASEYGAPHATFIVRGQIQSQVNSTAISNIQVIMGSDTSYSDENGKYEAKKGDFPKDQTFLLKFNDIDGVSNGEFNSLDSVIEFKSPTYTKGDGKWYRGETEKELNIQMKPKK